jgi:putative nucleotidyltransferase with HDIG domain
MSLQSFWTTTQVNKKFKRREVLKLLLIGLLFIAGSVFILEVQFLSNDVARLKVGDIAPQDIIAPAQISYESRTATEAEKDRAESRVTLYYSRPDPEVARNQRAVADQVLAFLDAVRTDPDPYLMAAQKLDLIQQIQPASLTREEAAAILNLNDTLWLDAKQEVRSVLDDVMRQEIRESQLISARRRLNLLISADVPEAEAKVIIAIAEDLVQPNTFVDEVRTNEERQKARDSVLAVSKTLEQNEIVVREGERITEETIEALQALGLQQPETRWHDIASTSIWITILVTLLGYYLVRYHIPILKDNARLGLLILLMLVYIVAIRIAVPAQETLPYTLPAAGLTIIVAVLLDSQLALVVTLVIGLIEAYIGGGSLELLVYVILSGFIVALAVGSMAQLNTLLWAGLYTSLSNTIVILTFRFFENNIQFFDLLARVGGGLLSGVLSAGLPLLAFFIVGNVTDMITYIQLLELSRPTHPLLTELLRRAPGTYHHSLLVSNLAEQAAERIGINAFLCRIGAYYHDVGKMMRPYFFTENIPPGGANLHANLDNETSAQIIISHVTDGLKLAKKYRLPAVIRSFIAEHHGTEVVGYFYRQALKEVDEDQSKVDRSRFIYPGPKPQTKESAILMLADASEATVRSVQPHSSEEIDEIVRRTIANRMKSGQFNECDLTMRDLEQIRLAFIDVLQGVSHPRIKYPEQVKEEAQPEDTGPLPPLPLAVQGIPQVRKEEAVSTTKSTSVPRD